MPWIVGGAILGGSLLGGIFGSSSADKAAKAQERANAQAIAEQRRQYEETRGDLAPYRDVGAAGLSEYATLLGLEGPEAMAAARERFATSPGYEFAFDEGTRAVEGGAAARGGLLSGGTLKDLTRFGQGTANKEYGSYLDRFLGLSSLGENAAAQTGNFGARASDTISNLYSDSGAARAGGYLAQGQAYTGAIDNALKLGSYGYGKGWFGSPTSRPNPRTGYP